MTTLLERIEQVSWSSEESRVGGIVAALILLSYCGVPTICILSGLSSKGLFEPLLQFFRG